MIPNFIQKYLSKRINFTYDEVDPGSFDRLDSQAQMLKETIDSQVTALWVKDFDGRMSALKKMRHSLAHYCIDLINAIDFIKNAVYHI